MPYIFRPVAQLVEQRSPKPQVGGSSPSWPAIINAILNGVLAGMNVKAEVESTGMDTAKLLVAIVLLFGGIGLFYFLSEYSTLLRVLGLLVVTGAAVAVALQTASGRRIWEFASASRIEVRKVVWPSRQETVQTTLIVFAMVLVVGIVLWLFDMLLMTIVRAVTG